MRERERELKCGQDSDVWRVFDLGFILVKEARIFIPKQILLGSELPVRGYSVDRVHVDSLHHGPEEICNRHLIPRECQNFRKGELCWKIFNRKRRKILGSVTADTGPFGSMQSTANKSDCKS